MKQTDFRDVPDELWERIEPLLAPFKRKRSGGSKPLSQRTIPAGILYKSQRGYQCYAQKSTVHEHFQRWSKAGVMVEIFRILLAVYGKNPAWMPNGKIWTTPCSSSDALSKKQRLRASDATRRTKGEVAARSTMWRIRVFLWE